MTDLAAITISDLRKSFNGRVILDRVSLELHTGRLLLLSGDNGSGKTTLMRILAGLEKPDQGRFELGGGFKYWGQARKSLLQGTVYLHQAPYMFDGSVARNLEYAVPRSLAAKERQHAIEEAIDWAGLQALANQDAKSLSGGERQRVALARAWLCRPRVLLLDEPTANMDAESCQRTLQLMQNLRTDGHALLVVSHDPAQFAAITDYHYRLDNGKLTSLERQQYHGQDDDRVSPIRQASM